MYRCRVPLGRPVHYKDPTSESYFGTSVVLHYPDQEGSPKTFTRNYVYAGTICISEWYTDRYRRITFPSPRPPTNTNPDGGVVTEVSTNY